MPAVVDFGVNYSIYSAMNPQISGFSYGKMGGKP